MNRKQEICRDFQRGNCRFGTRCKYLHITPQQQRQQQQQQQNDFGGGGNYYSALGNNSNFSNQKQVQNQNQNQNSSSAKDHRCSDPRVCKDQIREDFTNEHPLFWRLTCYAHYKFLPNDIVGDVSPEELRALAYEGAKQGLSLKDVAQREASMVAAKNAEFDNLLRSPYQGPAAQNSSGFQSATFSSSPFLSPQKNSTFAPFGQPATLSTPSPPQVFGQSPFGGPSANPFGFGQPSGNLSFGKQVTNISNGNASPFGQQMNLAQQSPFGGIAPALATQSHPFPVPSPQGPNMALNNNGFQQPSFFAPTTPQTQGISPGFSSAFSSPPGSEAMTLVLNTTVPVSQGLSISNTLSPQTVLEKVEDNAVWLKDVWKIGEIPEGEPPPGVRF